MVSEILSLPLADPLEKWAGSTRSSRIRFTFLVFLLILILETARQVTLQHFRNRPIALKEIVFEPLIVAYVLSSWFFVLKPVMKRAMRSLSAIADTNVIDLINSVISPDRWHQWWQCIILCGIFGMLAFTIPMFFQNAFIEDIVISSLVDFMMFAVFGCLLYSVMLYVRLISVLVQKTSTENIFDPKPYQPVAQWSLAVSLTVIGGVIINLLLQGGVVKTNYIIIYTLFIIVAVIVFIMGMKSTHQVMHNNKTTELDKLNIELMEIHKELLARVRERQLEKADSLLELASKINTHKQIIKKAAEWPYTVGNIRSLVVSILIPVLISLIKSVIG
jgi:hypothetical protein